MQKNLRFMSNSKKNEELQSRREFFKQAAKAALPVVGAAIMASVPFVKSEAANSCSSCGGGCSKGCTTSCGTNCAGRAAGYGPRSLCETCKTACTGCTGGCSGACKGTCYTSSY